MYANQEKNEYEAMVSRVRKHFGNAVEVGGYNDRDRIKLRKLDAKRETDEARERESRPVTEAATRLHRTRERAMKAWHKIGGAQASLQQDWRLHVVNGIDPEWLDPVSMPKWDGQYSTVAEYDNANTEAAQIATDLETLAGKLSGYVNQWESWSPDLRTRSLVLALADRLDRLEAERG